MYNHDFITLPCRVGKVSLIAQNESLQIQFSTNGQRYRIKITSRLGLKANSQKDLAIAAQLASQIDLDIKLNKFDPTLKSYGLGEVEKVQPIRAEKWDLKRCFEIYKADKLAVGNVPSNTLKFDWGKTDRILDYVGSENWDLEKPYQFLAKAQEKYAIGTLVKAIVVLSAAINHCIKAHGVCRENKFQELAASLKAEAENGSDEKIEFFSLEDVARIIEAFKNNELVSKFSYREHSYFADFVEWQFLTGMRPSESIALTWEDVPNLERIKITKAYGLGKIGKTKNGKPRFFRLNQGQKEILERRHYPNATGVIFKSQESEYIDLHNFSSRYWRPVVLKLASAGEIEKYLKFYCLRHSFATHALRAGLDIKRLADILGHDVSTCITYYLGSDHSVIPPDFNL